MLNVNTSPSRKYVAVCLGPDSKYYFRKFTLPVGYINDTNHAAWYFLNRLDAFSAIIGCFTDEDFTNVKEIINETA